MYLRDIDMMCGRDSDSAFDRERERERERERDSVTVTLRVFERNRARLTDNVFERH